jgi:hypothetical protein
MASFTQRDLFLSLGALGGLILYKKYVRPTVKGVL